MSACETPLIHWNLGRKLVLAAAAFLLLNACQREAAESKSEAATESAAEAASVSAAAADAAPYDPAHDYFSFANTDDFVTEHLVLDLTVDFPARALRGTATLRLKTLDATAKSVILDTRALDITSASVGRSSAGQTAGTLTPARFSLGETHESLGQPLTIELPEGFDTQGGFELVIAYHTSPEATALQWLPAELTSGGQQPLMFSQSQSIHARSWVPLQDSPAVRITYSATVRTPPELRAVMSANNDPDTALDGEYHFEMPQPIPSYLLAIAAGNLAFAPIGADTGVYSEPELLEASSFEFAETQAMLDLAENLLGPYEWGRYDLLILPPSFPYGGMENPRLSFITPSVLAGDRSLVSLIAHELAHSWSGNLVTNATWRDIWINEGTTSYLDSRLIEALFSQERADEERVLSWESLQQDVQNVRPEMQPLAPRLLPSDGEDGMQSMYYAKGQFFLEHLERLFGRASFDEYLTGYFQHFKWQSITTEQFLDYLDANLLSKQAGIYSRAQAEQWLYQPGVPADFQPPESASLAKAAAAARAYAAGEVEASGLGQGWSPHAVTHFINHLPTELSTEQLEALDVAMGLSATRNAEIGRAWYIQVAKRRHQPAYASMAEYLRRHGRMRLVTPVYEGLVENGTDAALAREIFESARSTYHPITIKAVEAVF